MPGNNCYYESDGHLMDTVSFTALFVQSGQQFEVNELNERM
jgi:hypothetical protein